MTPWGKLPLVIPLRPKGHTSDWPSSRAVASCAPIHPSWLRTQECLRAHNARRQAQGTALREALRRIDEATGSVLMAWDVRSLLDLAALGRRKPPTLRTIQLHLKCTRAERRNAQSNQRSEIQSTAFAGSGNDQMMGAAKSA
jgi:hypothetical protein